MPTTTARTETITADQLRAGDVVTCLPRDHVPEHPHLAVGRAQVEDVQPYSADPAYVWVRYNYASRLCSTRCHDDPYSCWHFGGAGGGSGRMLAAQQVERYVR